MCEIQVFALQSAAHVPKIDISCDFVHKDALQPRKHDIKKRKVPMLLLHPKIEDTYFCCWKDPDPRRAVYLYSPCDDPKHGYMIHWHFFRPERAQKKKGRFSPQL